MKYRLLGNSGLRVSEAPLGAMTFGEDCPHAITWTHADEVNRELANFLGKASAKKSGPRAEGVKDEQIPEVFVSFTNTGTEKRMSKSVPKRP